MGIIDKDGAMYLATGVDTTGLLEGKREVLEILKTMVQETASLDVFSDIELAAATAFTRAAANTYELSRAFEYNMQTVATLSPLMAASLGDYENRVITMTRTIPVAADDCAVALYRIVTAGYDGSEAMSVLEQAAREAVVAATSVAEAFARMQESDGGVSGWKESFSDLDFSGSMSGMDTQLQLLQNNIFAVTRAMGEQVTRQVADVATRLGNALSDGRVEKSFRSLDTLITLASGALADYRNEVEDSTREMTAESAALEIASGIRQAYHEVVENGIVQREAELQQQQALQASLAQSQALEAQGSVAKDQLLGKSAEVINMFAEEDAMYWRKIEDARELLKSEQQELALDNDLLASAEKMLTARKEELDAACKAGDLSKIEIALEKQQDAVKQKEVATMNAANMTRKVAGTQIRLNTLERRGETVAIVGNTVVTNTETLSNVGNATSTGLLTKAKQRLTIATLTLGRAMMANPLGLVLGLVSMAVSAFSMFGKKTEDSATAVDKLNESLDKQKELSGGLVNTLYDENESDQKRVAALLELRKLYPEVWDKVNLANLGEHDRNKLLKEGNELLEKKRIKELEAKKAASEKKIEQLEKEKYEVRPINSEDNGGALRKEILQNIEKEKQLLKEVNAELETSNKLESAAARERMTKDERLAEYNRDLETLSERLKGVRDRISEVKGKIKDAGNPFSTVLEQVQLAGLEQEEKGVQKEFEEKSKGKEELSAPKVLTEDEKKALEEAEKNLQETIGDLKLKYSKEAKKKEIAGMAEGRFKIIEEIKAEYAERVEAIDEEEKKLKEKHDKLGKAMPASLKQVFEKERQVNKEEEAKRIAEINKKNDEEVERRTGAMRNRAVSGNVVTEEARNRESVEGQFKGDREWLENQKKNKMPDKVAKEYEDNINLAIQKEQHARLLAELNDYNQKRLAIIAEWDAKEATAKEAAALNPALKKDNLEEKLKAEKEKALSALGTEQLMQSEEWTGLFENLDELTISQIDELTGKIQAKMAEVQKGEGENGTVNAFKITSKDMKMITAELNKAKEKIATLNPFRAMGDSMKEMFAGGATEAGDASQKIGDKWKNLGKSTEGCFEFVNEAVGSCSVLSDVLGESGQQTMGMIQGVATAGIMMAGALKQMEKGSVVLAVVSAALMAVNAIASMFNGDKKQEKKIKRLQRQIDDLDDSYNRLGTTMENTYSDKVYGMMEDQNENLRQQQELIEKQIKAEDKKKKTDKGKIRDWQSQLKDIDEQIAENERKQVEMLAGTDVKSAIDSFADALTDAYSKGEDGAKALGDTTKKVMANAVKESLKKKFLGDAINDAVNYLGNAMGDGVLTAEEQAKFEEMVQKGGENFTAAMGAYQNLFKDADGALGEGVTGQLQAAMTEGTASQLVGLWNTTASDVRAIRDWLLTGVATMPESPFDMTRMIDLQNEIAVNTRMTAQSTTATMYELHEGLMRMDYRLEAIEMNTRGYGGRGR